MLIIGARCRVQGAWVALIFSKRNELDIVKKQDILGDVPFVIYNDGLAYVLQLFDFFYRRDNGIHHKIGIEHGFYGFIVIE